MRFKTVLQPAAPAPAARPAAAQTKKGGFTTLSAAEYRALNGLTAPVPARPLPTAQGVQNAQGTQPVPGVLEAQSPKPAYTAGPAPRQLTPVTPVTAVETPASEPVMIPAPQPMPHAVSDDTVLDILPELPDEAPAADHETEYVRNDPHALSALPDMVSTRPEQTTLTPPPASEPLRLVGEVFKTYIITERGSELCLIDKHAAHERILFEQLARDYGSVPSQMLLVPVQVNLTAAEKQAVLQNLDLLTDAGIEAEDFGGSTVVVRAVPADVPVDDVEDMIVELAAKLADGGRDALREKTEWVLHSIACRAAIKAGDRTNAAEMLALAQRIMDGTVPPFCPHGRPCVLKITRKELEKQFGRLV